jgi:uncharacterized membrane protein YedE/YeeE
MRAAIALAAGILFGMGLALSGMIDPARVRAFLDLFGGRWDPTLAFVMAGAILPMAIAWKVQRRMARPISARNFHLPGTAVIDARLLGGAALFGIGWGLAGLCPGPAIADLALVPGQAAPFIVAMIVGFGLHHLLYRPHSVAPSSGLETSKGA